MNFGTKRSSQISDFKCPIAPKNWHQPLTSNREHKTPHLERVYTELAGWCRARGFAGYDPFDGLNSRAFQATPLRRSRAARLVWTQAFKRSPINLRRVAGVPAERNAKGTALFALAAIARFRMHRSEEWADEARELIELLLAARINNWSGAAWGYNFDWQGRAFYAPRGTPTIVPTAFAVRALVEAADAFADERYTAAAHSACRFILDDLHRSVETEAEVCFSYSPLDRTRVFNASLLAAETLASVGRLTGEQSLREMALRAARYVIRGQRPDGSWPYGAEEYQSWTDNFHTAFVLTSLARIAAACDAPAELIEALRRGYHFWRTSFFLADGWPKYYHDRLFPADAHSAGAALVASLEVRRIDTKAGDDALELAEQVASWAVRELRDNRGFFYYQRRRFYTVRTPYMRWAQAWMLYGLARLMEEKSGIRDF